MFIFHKSYVYIALVLEVLYRPLCAHNDGIKKKKKPPAQVDFEPRLSRSHSRLDCFWDKPRLSKPTRG